MAKMLKSLTAFICALSLCACSTANVPELLEPVGVERDSQKVTTGDVIVKEVFEAQVVPKVTELSFESDAKIYDSYVSLGDYVEKDDILLEIDITETNKQIESAKETLEHNDKINAYKNILLSTDVEIAQLKYDQLNDYVAQWAKYNQAMIDYALEKEEELRKQAEESLKEENLEENTQEENSPNTDVQEPEITEPETEEPEIQGPPIPEPEKPTVPEVTDSQLALAKAEVETAQMNLQQERERQQLEKEQLEDTIKGLEKSIENNVLTAPFSGQIVYYNNLIKGDYIKAYEAVICIADENILSISSEFVSERDIELSKKNIARIADKEYKINYNAMSSSEYMSLALSGKEINSSFSFKGDISDVSVGEYALIEIYNEIEKNVLVVPSNSVYGSAAVGFYVYLIIEDELVKTDIEKGAASDSFTQVIKGLKEGDVVYVQS